VVACDREGDHARLRPISASVEYRISQGSFGSPFL
jgi:hypothetical protein